MRLRDAVSTGSLFLLLFAGYVKGSPVLAWVPVDLTALGAVLVGLFCVTGWLRDDGRLPTGFGWVVALVVTFLIPLWHASDTTYGREKVDLLAITLLCLVGPMFVVHTRERLLWLLRWLAFGGVAVTALAQYGPQASIYDRLATAGGGTIGFGRATGVALVAVVALALAGKLPKLPALALAGLLAYSLVGSGSRGPLIAAGVAILFTVALRRSDHRLRNTLLVGSLGAIGIWWAFERASSFTQDRILLLFADYQGASIDARSRLYRIAAEKAWEHMFGLGWGGLETFVYPLTYPHNIVLEVFAEGGWLAGGVLTLALIAGFVRAHRLSSESMASAVIGLLVFYVVNAMVSGDINDNRAMFAALGLALALPGVLRRSHLDDDDLHGAANEVERTAGEVVKLHGHRVRSRDPRFQERTRNL